jgi:Fur family peroxide stress response transcriptional regulator
MSTLSDVREKLVDANLKATHQRIVIYDAVLQMMDHPTAERVFDHVKPSNPSISIGTVYKTLDTLVEAGLVHKVSSTDHSMRYDSNIAHHNHIYLEDTKEIVDYHDEELQSMVLEYLKRKKLKNIEIKDVQLQINARKVDKDSSISIK